MFTTIVASVIFAVITIIGLIIGGGELLRTNRERQLERSLQLAAYGTYKVWDGRKLLIMFAVWFVCGWYLFG